MAALNEVARGRTERVVRPPERIDAAVAVVIEADVQPHFRHPLGVAHRTGPGAVHLGRCRPATLDDHEGIEKFLLPIGPSARLAPGECGKRRDDRAHVVLLHIRIAIGGFDAPEPYYDGTLDAEILLD